MTGSGISPITSVCSLTLMLCGCTAKPTGPPSANEDSTARAELTERVAFVETYVNFRRKYEQLEYDVMFQNNSGGAMPGPSDWDIRLVAQVPPSELADWIPKNAESTTDAAPEWLMDIPGEIEREGISEWYEKGGRQVGLDRQRSIVAYRNFAN